MDGRSTNSGHHDGSGRSPERRGAGGSGTARASGATAGQPTDALALHHRYDPDHRVIAVTGACSFLGRELIRRLEEDRRCLRVLALDVQKPPLPLTKTQFHKVDLTLPIADAEVAAILREHCADTLVHLAFLSRPTHNSAWGHELEAIGTMYVLNACAASGVHKVIVGSHTAVYGAHPHNPNFLTEKHAPAEVPPSRFYRDKLEAERLAHRLADENPATVVTILRMAPILGHRVDNWVSRYFALPAVPVMMGYDPLVQLLHEDDAVDVLKLAVDADFAGAFNVASDGVLPLSTLLAMAGRITVPIPHILASPLAKLLWVTQVSDIPPSFLDFLRFLCVVDTARCRKVMGCAPRHDIRQIVTEFAGTAPVSRDKALTSNR